MKYKINDGSRGNLTLPAYLRGLPPRASVTLWVEADALPGESIFVKSVFAPMQLYINSELFYIKSYEILTITVDNSCSGTIRKKGNSFLSAKREGEGIGISSVMAVADKYKGGARFEEDNGVFKASMYLKLCF